ncbi:MAG: hypothetical protein R6V10_16425 [bacterium]
MKEKHRKPWRKLAALCFGVGLLVMVEVLLRLFDAAPPGRPVSDVFAFPEPVFEKQGHTLRTDSDKRKYFLDQSFPANKKAGTLRVFITGGSAAMGFPLQGVYGPDRLLTLALDAAERGREHEVINAGGFGYASYRLVPVVEELLDYDPDAIVLMTGNNEFLEKRFPHVTEGGLSGALYHLRLYRVFAGAASLVRGRAGEVNWDAHRVSAKERTLVTQEFEKNLKAMARLCRERGVPLVLVVPPSNLKDYRPYGPSRLPRAKQTRIDRLLKDKKYGRALQLIKKNRTGSPEAWLFFEEGWAKYGMEGRTTEAVKLWRRARDLDPVPVRIPSAMADTLRLTSEGENIMLADGAAAFGKAARLSAAPGDALFFDHCHPRPAGQRVLALEVIRSMVRKGLLAPRENWEGKVREALAVAFENLEDKALAQSFYQAAYESGVNMGRVCRGQELLKTCLALDPSHRKAALLKKRLARDKKDYYCLTGD